MTNPAFANLENAISAAVRAAQADGVCEDHILEALRDKADEVEMAPAFRVLDAALV